MSAEPQTDRRPTRLLNRHFLLLWQGQSISRLGDQAFTIAMLFWAKHTTGSATLIGLILMASGLPAVILGPIGGTLADRHSRRKIIVLSDLLCGVVVLCLAGLMFLSPGSPQATLIALAVASVLMGMVEPFFGPAASAAIPDLVPRDKVTSANSLGQLSGQFSMFIGQAAGGTLFRLLGAPVLFLIDGLTYLFAAISESFVAIPQTLPEKAGHWRDQLREFRRDALEGMRYIRHRPGLRELVLISALLNFLAVPVIVLLPFYVEDSLRAPVDWYGFILGAYGAGSVLGYLLAGSLQLAPQVRGRLMLVLFVLEPIGYALLGLLRQPNLAIVLAALGGIVNGLTDVYVTSVIQVSTPGDIRGRVFGLLGTIAASIAPVAAGLSGVIADLTGQNIPAIYVGSGLMMATAAVLAALNPPLRAFLIREERTEERQEEHA